MYVITTEASFDAAHFLKDYPGKCHNIHGHRWKVQVSLQAETLGAEGMVIDFGIIKKDLKTLCETFDHTLIIEEGSLKPQTVAALQEEDFALSFVPFRPTAEHFSRYFFEALQKYPVLSVDVYETPGNKAHYEL
ncbi:6-carboxytetrahydropterin synthase QueD [Intestinibaculum porci]|uniref:6-carboxytetrahydropterin synthase QueD n=1 Tax=Intestinibaculum porci TaxID=2487118 RepID=UPI00240914F3|nr:6-carboxytetrahydropterin synthase QueD [Intestinibaculum porci]MDD6349580.1 6-carboxytetrahydropterin synthase QueD [Intestinibaculum porci]MDD6423714.1 6-carboxytetrahydropterin synthase QueD [Intestinibaculum porci]